MNSKSLRARRVPGSLKFVDRILSDTIMLWQSLLQLPPEVLASHVLIHLSWRNLVKLEQAWPRDRRGDLVTCASRIPAVELPYKQKSNRSACVWFWKREIKIHSIIVNGVSDLSLSDIVSKLTLIDTVELRLHGERDLSLMRDTSKIISLLGLSKSIILYLSRKAVANAREIFDILCRFGSFERVDVSVEYECISPLVKDLIARNPALSHLSIGLRASRLSVHPLSGLRSIDQLTTLEMTISSDDDLLAVAKYCPNITTLRLTGGPSQGLLVLAKSCPKLRDVQISCMAKNASLLATLAAHCPDLRRVSILDSILDEAALSTMAANCPHLTSITTVWRVQHVDSVHAAQFFLSKLETLDLHNGSCLSGTTMGTTVEVLEALFGHCTRMKNLRIEGLGPEHDSVLHTIARRCHTLESLHLESFAETHAFPLGAAMASIAEANCNTLTNLHLKGRWLSESQLRTIIQPLRWLKTLEMNHLEVDDALLCHIAKCCPRLQTLKIIFCKVTDIGFLTLVNSCPDLGSLRMDMWYPSAARNISVNAFIDVGTRSHRFLRIWLPDRFAKEDRNLLFRSVEAAGWPVSCVFIL